MSNLRTHPASFSVTDEEIAKEVKSAEEYYAANPRIELHTPVSDFFLIYGSDLLKAAGIVASIAVLVSFII